HHPHRRQTLRHVRATQLPARRRRHLRRVIARVRAGAVHGRLIAARGTQGIGGGMIVSCVFATLGDLFTPLERAKYFAFMTGMFTFSLMAGPTFGGFLTDGPGWRWCFYINLPLGAVAATLIAWKLPSGGGSGGRPGDVDFLGSGLLTTATITGMLAVVWSSAR